jgi:hypothetical protein
MWTLRRRSGGPEASRVRWEAYKSTTVGSRYHSELFQELDARCQAKGRVAGEASAVLTVLAARGVSVPEAIRDRILACTDLDQLDVWLRRAATATTDEVINP